ncbi:hypothetical protein UCREL1_4848 [Eutypa lata UCREL1]|uniref:Uncharacterized protein n=1 Tax=Eutypa lata (strain UCR-EL1) TaxID=1287681 RepID=M7SUF1_EUTLA|nr:hypothetical protein UCREL1_4848 [Eutypa lata UCREL1]
MTALTAESLRRLSELGTRSPFYGPGVASVSKSEYARSVAASVDLIEQKDDWDVSSKGSTEVVIFDRPDPRSSRQQKQQKEQQQQQQRPPIRRAMTDVADDDSDDDEDEQRRVTRPRRRASECIAPAPGTLQKALGKKRGHHQHQEPKSDFLKNRLRQARAELLNKHDIQSVAGSSAEGEPSASSGSSPSTTTTSRKRATSLHYQPERPAYLQSASTGGAGMGGMPDWDADVAALRSPSSSSSSRPVSAYAAYRPSEPVDRFGSPDIMELTSSGSLNGGSSVPATPIDPEAMWPEGCPPSVPPSPSFSETFASSKNSIVERGRRLSRLVTGGRSSSSRPASSHSYSFAPFVAAVTTSLRSPSLPPSSPSSSSLHPSISISSSSSKQSASSSSSSAISPLTKPRTAAINNDSDKNSERGRRTQRIPSSPKAPSQPQATKGHDHGHDNSRGRSRSRSPAAGTYVEDPTRRRSFIDRALDKAELRVSQEINKHLVRAGRRQRPSFRVRSVSKSPVEDIASWRIGDGSPTSPPPRPSSPPPTPAITASSNRGRGRARERGSDEAETHRRAASVGVGAIAGRDAYWDETREQTARSRAQGLRKNNKKLHRPSLPQPQPNQCNIAPYRPGVDRVENDAPYLRPMENGSDELFGISAGRADSTAGLFEQPNNQGSTTAQILQYYHPLSHAHNHDQQQQQQQQQTQEPLRRKSTPKLVIDTQFTHSPGALPAAIYDTDSSDDDAPHLTKRSSLPSKMPRKRRNRNDSLFLGSDVSTRFAQDSFFPSTPPPQLRPRSHPHSNTQPQPRPQSLSLTPPSPRQRPQVSPRAIQAYRPAPPAVELEASVPVRDTSSRICDDDSILPDRPLDLGVRPSEEDRGEEKDEDDREVLPSQVSRKRSPSPSLNRHRRTLNRKAGNRNLR